MTSSGTYTYNPDLGSLTLEAFSRIQVRPTSITRQHMIDAIASANLLLVEFSVRDGPNLWEIVLNQFPMVQGTATYSVPGNIIAILDYYVRINAGTSGQQDLVVYPISRTEYSSQPNKLSQARPTTVWWNRQIASTLTFWQVPDGTPYQFFYYAMTQPQDAVMPAGVTMDLPYRFLDAFAAGLALRLAQKYPPPPPRTIVDLKAEYDEAWTLAAQQDIEQVPLVISPGLTSYYRY